MKQRLLIRTVVGVVVAVLTIGTWITSGKLDIGWLRFFSASVFIASAGLAVWDLWLWRLGPIQRITGVPRCIRGTWKGTLTSLWVDPNTGAVTAPKTAFLVVRQTASLVSARLITDESDSRSKLAAVSVTDGTAELDYMYVNRPRASVEHRSRMHHGSTVLDVSGRPAIRLEGRYWTDRDSRGELVFDVRSKSFVDSYAEAVALLGP